MYFPVIHSARFDILALAGIGAEIRSSGTVIPVLIPVAKNEDGLRRLLRRYTRSGQPFCFVVNPICCRQLMPPDAVNRVMNDVLAENRVFHPTMMLNAATTRAEVDVFCERFPEDEMAFFHLDELRDAAALETVAARGRWHLLEPQRRAYVRRFAADTRVLIEDPFRKVKNADYPEDESFSDTYAEFSNDGFAGFGDYQIVGRDYSPGGFTPRAVALHLTYTASDGAVRARHFVSDTVTAAPEVPGRFLEVLEELVDWAGEDERDLEFSKAVAEYRALLQAESYPGLGTPKRLGIQHHIELMMSLL
ncbi:sce7725 family protein [Longimicrobium terrae]|uniref:Sce7725 family protein n=1 Tax=Longimicrobium terrae TaxID=1639882 RepID=A0A841H1M2_9BACT|nr:sce7725 family protein [Longimicrobium terrae]MBB4637520.1 hypothetical protein [Longimicrobium terrae]MBB6071917.1 hypothetical protein [Longimicrobium terrae]NNC30464.1 sce7725 family protein [Longimicrobium terrae]